MIGLTGLLSVLFISPLVSSNGISSRILNGQVVGQTKGLHGETQIINNGQYPFMVALEWLGIFSCGAVIIREDIVLTAAHCVKDYPSEFFIVRAGTLQKRDKIGEYVQERKVKRALMHPEFNNASKWDKDIAILFLVDSFVLNRYVNVIALASLELPGLQVEIIGWGKNEQFEDVNDLRKADVTILPNNICSKALKDLAPITDNMVCGYSSTLQGACKGDSGGPMIYRDPGGTQDDKLIGVSSFGRIREYVRKDPQGRVIQRIRRCKLNSPFVYTKISSLKNWIFEQIEK